MRELPNANPKQANTRKSALPRPQPLPASPHLSGLVLKMRKDEEDQGPKHWPPQMTIATAPRPHDFLTKCSAGGGKKVAWPPHLASNEDLTDEGENENITPQDRPHSLAHKAPNFNQNLGAPNVSAFPSGFKFLDEAPLQQPGIQTVPSQPAFKITEPVRKPGDTKWPPNRPGGTISQEEVRQFLKPKKTNRDYSEFFAQNALPNTYPAYRAPPGTQHREEI